MPTLALRAILAALAAALLLSIGDVVLAQSEPAPATAEDQRLLPYVEQGTLVDIGGRRIHLHCTGAGACVFRRWKAAVPADAGLRFRLMPGHV